VLLFLKKKKEESLKLLGTKYDANHGGAIKVTTIPTLKGSISSSVSITIKDEVNNNKKVQDKPDTYTKKEVLLHDKYAFLPFAYLKRGAERGNAVVRIETPTQWGSGFLCGHASDSSFSILLTNAHVLKNYETDEFNENTAKDIAKKSWVEFYYEDGNKEVRRNFLPEKLFISSPTPKNDPSADELDCVFIACEPVNEKPIRLKKIEMKDINIDDATNIIQHPAGRKKQVSLRLGVIKEIKDYCIRYTTDTLGGSSGSPVFNDQWDLLALHHAGNKEQQFNQAIPINAIIKLLQDKKIPDDILKNILE